MSANSNTTLDYIAAGGLLVGAVFGLAGTLVASPTLQASLWAIDSVALVVATSLLALRYFRAGVDVVAAGFLVFAIGEGVLLSGTAAGPTASVPAFAAGTALWAAALALISVVGARVRRCCPPRRHSRSSRIRSSSRLYWDGHGCSGGGSLEGAGGMPPGCSRGQPPNPLMQPPNAGGAALLS